MKLKPCEIKRWQFPLLTEERKKYDVDLINRAVNNTLCYVIRAFVRHEIRQQPGMRFYDLDGTKL